jgi:membrane protein implicated in regulation of membrane protease activity
MGFTLIIALTLVGFLALAALLLVPIWRFLDREEEVSEQWTREELAARMRRRRREQMRAEGEPGGETTNGEE